MKKMRIIIPLSIAVASVAIISFSIALAQGNEGGDSNASKLATKVAEILGLDTAVVDDAIKQAREELKDGIVQKKLNAHVEKGQLTQVQADEYLDIIQAKLDSAPEIRKQSSRIMEHHKHGKGHSRFLSPRNYVKGKPSLEVIQQKLDGMIEKGDITDEQAAAKLKALKAPRARQGKEPSLEGIGRKLRAAIENGDITREQARERLDAFRTKK